MLNELLALKPNSAFLSQLDEHSLAELADVLEVRQYSTGDELFLAGEASSRVLLLLDGLLISEIPGNPSLPGANTELHPGQLVGEAAFATGERYEHNVRALEDSRVAILDRNAFNHLMQTSSRTLKHLEILALRQIRRNQFSQLIDRLFGPFEHLLPYVIQDIEEEIEWLNLRSGETLYATGDEANHVYILLTGRLLMTSANAHGREKVLSTVLGGEIVGEVALLTEQPRTETVYATRDTNLVRLSKRGFGKMLERNIWAVNRISRSLAKKILHQREPNDAERMPIRTISLIPASAKVPMAELLKDITEVLSRFGSVEVLDRKAVDMALDMPGISQSAEDDPAHLRLMHWLQKTEENCRYLVYVGDRSWSAWTERCARQADRLAVVADATNMPDLDELEHRLSGPRQHWSLVLTHSAEAERPRGTARWLESSSTESVFHVRLGHAGDSARLARILSGNAVSLVLGGGGARGFAHLGVLRALEELGIPVDMTAGTSIGSPIAFLNAAGFDAAEATDIMATGFANLLDYTLPISSLLTGRRITDVIDHYCSPWETEDLRKPWFCVSTNLTRHQPKIHRRGNAGRAIRASVSIPGVLPPVSEDNEVLVDGGLLNNLPIDVMREWNLFGTVIAIDVVAPVGIKVNSPLSPAVSGWRLAIQKILPWVKPPETLQLASVVMNSMVAGSGLSRTRMLEQGMADFYFNIHVRGAGMLDFGKVREIAEAGYQQSFGPLREWAEQQELGNNQ